MLHSSKRASSAHRASPITSPKRDVQTLSDISTARVTHWLLRAEPPWLNPTILFIQEVWVSRQKSRRDESWRGSRDCGSPNSGIIKGNAHADIWSASATSARSEHAYAAP
jgi:hypothetical protein